MAEIFALSLLRHKALGDLSDPQSAVIIDQDTRFSLEQLLRELRALRWSARRTPLRTIAAAPPRRWRGRRAEVEITQEALFGGGVTMPTGAAGSPRLSALWREDHAVAVPDPGAQRPADDAPMSAWLAWAARHCGAGLRVPGRSVSTLRDGTLEEMAEDLHAMPPARPFLNAAVALLARGVQVQSGLGAEAARWGGSRLMRLLAEAEARAMRAAHHQVLTPDRLQRPAVMAARMTVWLAREERGSEPAGAFSRAVADELARTAPNLLYWMGQANAVLRQGPRALSRDDALRRRAGLGGGLFLPLSADPGRDGKLPLDCASHAVVAGALATLMKALLDPAQEIQLQAMGAEAEGVPLAPELDRMVADIGLARVVSGGWYPVENARQVRLGQCIAMQLLRESMEAENRDAELAFRDFDGRKLRIVARARGFGRGQVYVEADGIPESWPRDACPAAAHLTAVV
ncbi:hypothetical protein [Sagittula salina]|uniref:Uncharacterized protein n=1 Tax=Sagittula salina TaxID=2820268 RepID=A0A940S3Z2_9RHOB|nr:hypothetical protein [Sagittula salina]MBP0483559.1 hypothetical protein [Sagittula salina]